MSNRQSLKYVAIYEHFIQGLNCDQNVTERNGVNRNETELQELNLCCNLLHDRLLQSKQTQRAMPWVMEKYKNSLKRTLDYLV